MLFALKWNCNVSFSVLLCQIHAQDIFMIKVLTEWGRRGAHQALLSLGPGLEETAYWPLKHWTALILRFIGHKALIWTWMWFSQPFYTVCHKDKNLFYNLCLKHNCCIWIWFEYDKEMKITFIYRVFFSLTGSRCPRMRSNDQVDDSTIVMLSCQKSENTQTFKKFSKLSFMTTV